MNREDGEVCFRTTIAVTDHPPTVAEIDHFVRSSLATAERYLLGFMAIIRGDPPAKGAIALVGGAAL